MKPRHVVPVLALIALGCAPANAPTPGASASPTTRPAGTASTTPGASTAPVATATPAAPAGTTADSISFTVAGAAVTVPNKVEIDVSGTNGLTWDINAPERVAPPGEYYLTLGIGTTKGVTSPTFSTEEITTVSLLVGQGFEAGKLDRKWMKVGGDIKATVVNGKVDFAYKGTVTKAPGSSDGPETLEVDLVVKGLPLPPK